MDKFLVPQDRWSQPHWAGGPTASTVPQQPAPTTAMAGVVCDHPGCSTITIRSNVCETHLRDALQLEIKQSTIPGAGDGVFTLRNIPKGEYLMQYLGREVDARNGEVGGDYHLEYSRNKLVDASSPTCGVGRFLNDGLSKKANNCMFTKRDGRPWVRAIKNIPAGSELLLSYGVAYWRTWSSFHKKDIASVQRDLRRVDQAEADRQERRKKSSRWQSLRATTRHSSSVLV
jgi:SET domain-containing protein